MKIGIQLYSVRNRMENDPIDTIRKVAEAGYKHLEVANRDSYNDFGVGFGLTVQQTKDLLAETGVEILGAHIVPFVEDTPLDKILEFHTEIGTKYIVQAIDFFADKDELLRKTEQYNRIGEQCSKAGIQYLYHNHHHEFLCFDGVTIMELIMQNTDSDFVKLELDTYWACRGKQDPVEVMKKYGERVRIIHQKDYTKGYEDEMDLLSHLENSPTGFEDFMSYDSKGSASVKKESFTEIGTGILPIQDYIDAANKYCKCEYIVLEQDFSVHDEIDSIKISMGNFKKYTGVKW
ncbi:MAG: sugar phosphate isomerase/epimerase [Ruminococcaceae bacterium]|nr:sugar phosphate isomerase/epimerase [Oscillospiraceae bacterium]